MGLPGLNAHKPIPQSPPKQGRLTKSNSIELQLPIRADYQRLWDTNVFGVLRTLQASLESLKQSKGQLVVMGNVKSYLSLAGDSPYAMGKFALRALHQSLCQELAPMVSQSRLLHQAMWPQNFGVSITKDSYMKIGTIPLPRLWSSLRSRPPGKCWGRSPNDDPN